MKPALNYVLVLPDKPKVETSLIIPDTVHVPYVTGKVLMIGEGTYNQRTGDFRPVQLRIDDEICYTPNSGYLVIHDNLECLLLREEEVFTKNGNPINDWIGVEFDEKHNRVVKIGDLEIARPNEWVFEDHGYDKTMYDINRNLKETKPQIAKVVRENKRYGLKKGDLVFTHYLQYDNAIEVEGIRYVNFKAILFKINAEHDYEMADDSFLAKRLVVEAPKTESGIFLTPNEDKKEPLKLIITHVPRNTDIKVGDVIISEDDNQYEVKLHDEDYIYITKQWIVGVEQNDSIKG